MPPQTQAEPAKTPNVIERHPTERRRSARIGNLLVFLLLLTALIGAILEYLGVINLIPGVGRRGQPQVELGVWQPTEFTDVPDGFWAKPYIEELSRRGVIAGFPRSGFHPNQPITRAEFAAMLQTAFDQNPTPRFVRSTQAFFDPEAKSLTGGFVDVPADYWAGPAIADTSGSGFFGGFSNNTFRPEQPILRANAIAAIAGGLRLNTASASRDSLWFYRDAAQIPEYAKNAIAAATEAGIRLNQSNPPMLRPNQNLTRAEAAVLITKALNHEQS